MWPHAKKACPTCEKPEGSERKKTTHGWNSLWMMGLFRATILCFVSKGTETILKTTKKWSAKWNYELNGLNTFAATKRFYSIIYLFLSVHPVQVKDRERFTEAGLTSVAEACRRKQDKEILPGAKALLSQHGENTEHCIITWLCSYKTTYFIDQR